MNDDDSGDGVEGVNVGLVDDDTEGGRGGDIVPPDAMPTGANIGQDGLGRKICCGRGIARWAQIGCLKKREGTPPPNSSSKETLERRSR